MLFVTGILVESAHQGAKMVNYNGLNGLTAFQQQRALAFLGRDSIRPGPKRPSHTTLMATVTITRSSPVNQHFAPTTLQVGLPISTFEVAIPLASLLSGPLDDYNIDPDPTSSGLAWHVTAKKSYQERFREKQLKVHTLEGRLEAVEKRLAQMEQQDSCRDICITTVELYSRLGYGVSSFSFVHTQPYTCYLQCCKNTGFQCFHDLSKRS